MKTQLVFCGLMLGGATSVCAQALQRADAIAVERAAVAYVLPSLPKGVIAFDRQTGDATRRDSADIAELARLLGARSVSAESVYRCPGDPSTCRLDVDALVRIGTPKVSPEGAEVTIRWKRHTGIARMPVGYRSMDLVLSRKGASWTVVRIARTGIS